MRALLFSLLLALAPSASSQSAFAEEDITFASVDGVTLAGTVAVPDGDGPFPAVVLVSGSGLQDRDGGPDAPIFPTGYRFYRDLAHALTEAGILTLRYDERGVGESTDGPDPASVTTFDYADDAAAAVRALDARGDVRWVGIVGHSEGGTVAPLAAGAEPAVDAIVMVGAAGISGLDIVMEQNRFALGQAGVSDAGVEIFVDRLRTAFVSLAGTAGGAVDEAAREEVEANLARAFGDLPEADAAALGITPEAIPFVVSQQMQSVSGAWYRTFLALDPAEPVGALRVPALALYLALDQQVPPTQNAAPMRDALDTSSSPDWDVVTLDGLNHVFQRAQTGSVQEYATLPAEVDPAVPEAIAAWVLRVADE
ncbi:MAG: alpha/beta fold hydrolase [Bacteroidota bacterium]